jgi:4-diphosphocytidyl-2-C-methyl-D-erythritol kinase
LSKKIQVTAIAHAKVNLSLLVQGKRADGYHDLRSVFARIRLADILILDLWVPQSPCLDCGESFALSLNFPPEYQLGTQKWAPFGAEKFLKELPRGALQGVLHFGSDTFCYCVPIPTFKGSPDPVFLSMKNLVLKALRVFRERTGEPSSPVEIKLIKNIPFSSGLGGGSSDAAELLRNLKEIFSPEMPKRVLLELAKEVGADVPFFLFGGGINLVQGLGDIIEPYPFPPSGRDLLLLTNSANPLSTAQVFQELILTKSDSENKLTFEMPPLGQNDLFEPAVKLWPPLKQALTSLKQVVPGPCGLSGSGPSLWALFNNPDQARKAQAKLTFLLDSGWNLLVTQMIDYIEQDFGG